MSTYIVVTGLPASGKSTLARVVANALMLPLYDKDDILESLFDSLGCSDESHRQELSRVADEILARMVACPHGAVVVSWWRHPQSDVATGTPTDWLHRHARDLIELHCKCSARVAVERFFTRTRHRGHLDHLKDKQAELEKFERHAVFGNLGIGRLIEVDTEKPVDLARLQIALAVDADMASASA